MSSESVDEKSLLSKQRRPKKAKHVLVIHGGAGTILREKSSPEQQARYHAALRAALQAGNAILSSGGEAMDAVVAAVSVMEGKQCRPHRMKPRPVLDSLIYRIFRQSNFQRWQRRRIQLGRLRACSFSSLIRVQRTQNNLGPRPRPRRMNSKRRWRSPAPPHRTPTKSRPRAAPSH
jgi:hypothetical protein